MSNFFNSTIFTFYRLSWTSWSKTKINIDYYLNNIIDEDAQKEIYDYFLEDAETDDISEAYEEFDGDYSEDELRLMKIKFMSEMAN